MNDLNPLCIIAFSPFSVAFNAGQQTHTSVLSHFPSQTALSFPNLCFDLNFVDSAEPSASQGAPLQDLPPPLPLKDTNLP